MKSILGIFALLSASALADTNSNPATTWIQNSLGNQAQTEILGMSADGKCGLYLTDKQAGIYFVVVGIEGSKDMEDYIGVATTDDLDAKYDAALIRFQSDNSWGNSSRINTVSVLLDDNGSPVQAVGVSDRKVISCKLK